MPLTEAVVNTELDDIFQTLVVSLHTGDPGATGANEVTGGSYARQAESFGAASGRALTNGSDIVFTDMPAVTVTYIGFWTAGGTWKGGFAVTSTPVSLTQNVKIAAGNLDVSWAG